MKRIILGSTLLVTSTAVGAAPVYLKCSVSSGEAKEAFSVSLDEQNRKVTHTVDNGDAFNAEGFFSANKISYKNVTLMHGGQISVTWQYEIDRTNLTVVHTFISDSTDESMRAQIPADKLVYPGKCEVVKPPKRKI